MLLSLPPIERDVTTDLADRADQHSVPHCYLKGWTDPDTPQGAYIWVSPKDRSAAPQKRSPKKTFVFKDMNTMKKGALRNLRLESLYQNIETRFGIVKDRLIGGHRPNSDEIEAVFAFVAAQFVRTPKFHAGLIFDAGGVCDAPMNDIVDSGFRLKNMDVIDNIRNNNKQILSFIALSKVLEMLQTMRLTLLKTSDDARFITSDSPCCVVDYADKIAFPLECMESPTSNVIMALCPTVVAIFDHSCDPHGMMRLNPSSPYVTEINAIIWRGAVEKIVLPNQTLDPEWFSDRLNDRLSKYVIL